MAKEIKTLEQFRKTVEVIKSSEYNERYGHCLDDVEAYVLCYSDGYINIINDKEFYLVVGNQDWTSTDLRELEEILWDTWVKYNLISDADDIVNELHERIREFMDEQGWEPLSLDEQPLIMMTVEQLKRRNYYLKQFQVDAFIPEPELFVKGVAFIKSISGDYQFDRGSEDYYGYVNVSIEGMANENQKEWKYLCDNPNLLKKVANELGLYLENGKVDVGETIFHRVSHKLARRKVLVHDHVRGTNETIIIEDVWEPNNTLYPEKIRESKHCPIILVNDEEFERFMTTGFGWIHPDEVSVTLISL